MRRVAMAIKKLAIVCHRWMGVAFCVLFMWWFVSGIFMMYWGFPEVSAGDRLQRLPVLRAAEVKLSPGEAAKAAGMDTPPSAVRLASFDGRPAYFFRAGRGSAIVYADTGEQQDVFPAEMNLRTAARWTGQPEGSASVESVEEPDQWTVASNLRNVRPLYKYSFPDGQQVYVSENTGDVVQYTTTSSRIYAHLGAIPHWMYYTPLRVNGKLWTRVVIWSSGIATVAAMLGLIVGIWMYSPSKKYRHAGAPTSIPYTGQKRLHTLLGLFFGILAMTWAFSGMLSMDPFPLARGGAKEAAKGKGRGNFTPAQRVQQAFAAGRLDLAGYEAKHPAEVLARLDANFGAKELEYTSFAGEPVFHASSGAGETLVIPVRTEAAEGLNQDRVMIVIKEAAGEQNIAELRVLTQYDRYYLDRLHERPLPVIYAQLKDEGSTRLYIDPKTARVVGRYSESTAAWVNRWLYHGLHSLDFPWLYNYRPAWDIVVLSLMLACVWLCWTSLVLSYRVLKRKFGPAPGRRTSVDDLPQPG
ncbi:MAG: PepSY domain-containing protein [Acidobacteriota bacterium]